MSHSHSDFCEGSFDGFTRLFPLPGLVVYPHVVRALHIFEPRYRAMLEDAMAGDRLLSMGVLAPGWQDDYEGNPPVQPMVCLGKIVSRKMLPDGCSNILLLGLRRARIVEELETGKSFRTVRVDLLEDVYCPTKDAQRQSLQKQLLNAFQQEMPKSAVVAEQLMASLGSKVSLGMLTDLIAYSLEVSVARQLELLGEVSVDRRAECLLNHLAPDRSEDGSPRGFPPGFSVN